MTVDGTEVPVKDGKVEILGSLGDARRVVVSDRGRERTVTVAITQAGLVPADVDLGAGNLRRAGDALGRGEIELPTKMFGNNKNLSHHTNPFCLSAATSSATSFTITPFVRVAGGSYFRVLNCAALSTPRSAIAIVSSVFFFAFMMSGSFT